MDLKDRVPFRINIQAKKLVELFAKEGIEINNRNDWDSDMLDKYEYIFISSSYNMSYCGTKEYFDNYDKKYPNEHPLIKINQYIWI